jgi:sugar/nucleoside kinase (ribokinase family)
MSKLICFGDLCVDIVTCIAHGPAIGHDATIERLTISMAGAAVNCAVAAARHGARVELIGIAGQDVFGDKLIAHLVEAGVGTSHVARTASHTGTVISIVQANGERTLYSHRGANAEAYGALPEALVGPGDCVYLSGYSFQTEDSRNTALELKASAGVSALDPSYQFARDFPNGGQASVGGLDFLLPNLEEAQLITGRESVEACASAVCDMGVAAAVIKLGSAGCYIHSAGDTGGIRAYVPTQPSGSAVDTTGAGDAFCGAFLAAVLQGWDLIEAARQANTAAGNRVRR